MDRESRRHAVVALIAACSSPHAPPPSNHAQSTPVAARADLETFGELAVGISGERAEELLGPAMKADILAGGVGSGLHTTWAWPDQGVWVIVVMPDTPNARPDGPAHVHSIKIASPSKLRTSRGIGIGAKRTDVEAAYHVAKPADDIVIGAHGDGTMFRFGGNGLVREIFVGAMGW